MMAFLYGRKADDARKMPVQDGSNGKWGGHVQFHMKGQWFEWWLPQSKSMSLRDIIS